MADKASFRVLTEDERRKLEDNSKVVSDFKQNKLEKEAQKNWDLFYKRNTTNFFKDRHWTTAEFKELLFDNCEVSMLIWTAIWTNEWKLKSFENSWQMTRSPFGPSIHIQYTRSIMGHQKGWRFVTGCDYSETRQTGESKCNNIPCSKIMTPQTFV